MNTSQLLAIVFSGAASGIIAVAATIAYNFWAERRRLRIDCLRQLMRNRINDPDFLRAFNEVPIIFAGRSRVLAAHQATLEFSIASQTFQGGERLTKLIKAMTGDLKLRGISDAQLDARFGR